MRTRQRISTIILAAALLAIALPALAARPMPTFRALGAAPVRALAGPNGAGDPACALGVTGAPAWSVGYIIPGEDQYYTLLDPADCRADGECGVSVSLAHVILDFQYAMSTPVRVGLVQADLSDEGCAVPVPGAYVCAPIVYDLSAPDAGLFDVALPLSAGTALAGKVFLEITFTEWGPYWDVPGLVLTAACDPCRSYNYYPGDNYDLCTFGFDGNPVMYADVECDNAVAEKATTWGQLKASFR